MRFKTVDDVEFMTVPLLGWITVDPQEGEPPIVSSIRTTVEEVFAKALNSGFEEASNG